MLLRSLGKFLRDEDGITALEYALLASLIFVVIISVVIFVGVKVTNTYGYVGNEVANAIHE